MYTYKIDETGYHIYDSENPSFHIHQYEPYIPDHSKSYEENAQLQIKELESMPAQQPIFKLTEDMYTEMQSNIDYLMLLNDPDSASETVTE